MSSSLFDDIPLPGLDGPVAEPPGGGAPYEDAPYDEAPYEDAPYEEELPADLFAGRFDAPRPRGTPSTATGRPARSPTRRSCWTG
jgi:DNA helicase-2/ATP-dependent DNA helicase PcrA